MNGIQKQSGYARALLWLAPIWLAALGYGMFAWHQHNVATAPWTAAELALIESLSLAELDPLPPDAANPVAENPQAARLGQMLFFDTRLSSNGAVACATCHQPDRRFTDGLATARAIGESQRNTPSLVGVAYSPWLYWDGRKDSLWSQALSPLEDPAEHGGHRLRFATLLEKDPYYRNEYHALFGEWPDLDIASITDVQDDWSVAWDELSADDRYWTNRIFSNIGKVLAAYERQLMPTPARFDAYVSALVNNEADANNILTSDERAGLRLFVGDARCINCHNSPLFTNNEFHNTGLLPPSGLLPDNGRSDVLMDIALDVFNCLGEFNDAEDKACPELVYMRTGAELVGAMRTPSLRNLAGTEPYMHKGQMQTLAQVLDHYNRAPLALIGHSEVEPLGLSNKQLHQLEAFMLTLDAPIAGGRKWLDAPEFRQHNDPAHH